jgi:hypothetical protein
MNARPKNDERPIPNLGGMFCDLATQSFRFGVAVLEAFRAAGAEAVECATSHGGLDLRSCRTPRHGRCEIPPPCWVPKCLGEVTSAVCPGAMGTLRIRVTNCGTCARDFRVEVSATLEELQNITITPANLHLKSQERGSFVISAKVPPDTRCSNREEYLVWLRGCHDYYLRWRVMASEHGECSCHEICVEDCPDLIHHWYDHFYCERSCPRSKCHQ